MRIVATSDTHFPLAKDSPSIPDGDVFIHAGDLMYSGYINEWYPLVNMLKSLNHEHKYLVPGNHDIHIQNYTGPAIQELKEVGVTVVGVGKKKYHKVILPNGMTMIDAPWVTNLHNWAFNAAEEFIFDSMDALGRADIIVSHSPPMGILSRVNSTTHVGINAYRKYLTKFQPKYWIVGHIHEAYGTAEVEGCKFFNVAMCDHRYKQVNPPMIIDI